MPKVITVLLLNTKYGTDIFAFNDSDLADQVVDEYVLKHWDKLYYDAPIPEDINDAVELFFQSSNTVSYQIETLSIFESFEQFQEEYPL